MSRAQASQPQRTQNNPLNLGTFNTTAVRYLKGNLGPKNQVIGRPDTRYESNGGFGGGTYNHWFQVNLTKPGWIIIAKGPPRPKYIQISAYELDKTPIQGEYIFDTDSVSTISNGEIYIPYLNTITSSQSDLYNTYSRLRLDRGDERYYPLGAGSYLICVSTTRNEPLSYELALVLEFSTQEGFFELEDGDGSCLLQETQQTTESVLSPITSNVVIPFPGAFTNDTCTINSGVTVTIDDLATWFIGALIPEDTKLNYKFILEPGDESYYDTIHDHSLSEWRNAWYESHQDTDPFPDLLVPLTNRP